MRSYSARFTYLGWRRAGGGVGHSGGRHATWVEAVGASSHHCADIGVIHRLEFLLAANFRDARRGEVSRASLARHLGFDN